MSWYYEFRPYVSVTQRRAQAEQEIARRTRAGKTVSPVRIEGRTIARTFWGQAWCKNLESYSDFANRLPRGRTYVRNGSVVDLQIAKGQITALVSGSELYNVRITIAPYPNALWGTLKSQCAGKIGSLVELLQGKLSQAVMATVTDRERGLFPKPKEIAMECSCPDYAGMCKHVAAVMYGVGNRLDASPELLFTLRAVDHRELIEQAIPAAPINAESRAPRISTDNLGAIFGIEIGDTPATPESTADHKRPAAKKAPKPTATTKKPPAAKKKPAVTKKPTPTKKPKKPIPPKG